MPGFFARVRRELVDLNLFQSGLSEVEVIQEERWSTRLYIILLIIGLVILITYTTFGIQTVYVEIENPSLETFETLQLKYPETLTCPCTQIAVKYESFVQIQIIQHQICSSAFVTEEWISASYRANVSNIWPMDVRTVISANAQFLSTYCTNTQRAISVVLVGILSSSLVSADVMPSSLVQLQVNIQTAALRSASNWQLTVLLSFMRLTTENSHLMSGLGTNSFLYMESNDSSTATVGINIYQLNSDSAPCICLTTNNCPVPGAIYPSNQLPTSGYFNLETFAAGSIPIKGIQVGCFALESTLASTLECYYDASCIALLVPNSEQFPPLLSTIPSNFLQNTTIQTLTNALMVENWIVNMSYASYYAECAPKTCTYSFNQRNNFLIVFTTIFALIGGLSTVLQLFAPLIVQAIAKLKQRVGTRNDQVQGVVNVWEQLCSVPSKAKEKLLWLRVKIKMLNLFDSNSSNTSTKRHERQTTRLYIIFVTIAFVILLSFTVTTQETKVYTVQKPSQQTYENLYAEYPNTLECTCQQISIEYSAFILIQANFHQTCSSSFVSPSFFAQLAGIRTDVPIYPDDFMLMSVEYFEWLTTFCELSQLVFSNQLVAFQNQLFVNDKLLTHDVFDVQATQLADFFISDVQHYFSREIKSMRELIGFTQPLSATFTITYKLPITTTSAGSQVQIAPANFFSGCSCLSDPTSCSDQAAFYSYSPMSNSFSAVFNVSGIRLACSSMESFLQSNLACLYSSDCYETVVQYWQNRTYSLAGIPPVLDSTVPSRFPSSTALYLIVEELMVESWSEQISYDDYYSACAPLYCTYSITQRRDAILIVTILFGLFGGLNVALELLTPLLIKLGRWFVSNGRQCFGSFRRNLREFPSRLRELNLFYDRYQSSELTLKQELHSTRLYIVLFTMSMLILIFYYSLSQSIITVSIENPTQQMYEKLRQSEDLSSIQCPCTHVSITYGTFVQANTSLHEICASSFIDPPWIESILGNGDWSNLSLTEFHGRGVLYFQGLHLLCYLLQENITQYVTHFLASTFINAQVLSETDLLSQVNDTVEQVKASTRADYGSMYKFARDLENDNQMMTIYSTNWIYSPIKYDPNLVGLPISLVPVSHGNCSCSISATCTEPVTFQGEVVPGFVVSCLPLDTLFQSSLICLYNATCINQININNLSVTPLMVPSNNEFPINRTIEELIDNVLDLQWSVDISHPRFFDECQPAICSYSVNQGRGGVQIIVTLLGLYGGLTVALKMVIPYIVALIHRIFLKPRQLKSEVHVQAPEKY